MNPFSQLPTDHAFALASAFRSLHTLGHGAEDCALQLFASLRTVSRVCNLHNLPNWLNGCHFKQWQTPYMEFDAADWGVYDQLQELANEWLDHRADAMLLADEYITERKIDAFAWLLCQGVQS